MALLKKNLISPNHQFDLSLNREELRTLRAMLFFVSGSADKSNRKHAYAIQRAIDSLQITWNTKDISKSSLIHFFDSKEGQ